MGLYLCQLLKIFFELQLLQVFFANQGKIEMTDNEDENYPKTIL